MPTKKQITANRLNAKKSTGPRTDAGKTQSALNARKHGFTGSDYSVVRLEDVEAVAKLRDDAIAFYQPINSQEIFAVERIALCQMALIRIARLESGMLTRCLDRSMGPDGEMFVEMQPELVHDNRSITRAQNRNFALTIGFIQNTVPPHSWELFLRYQNQSERLHRRAVEDFNRLVALRPDPECEASPNEPNFAEPQSTQSVAPGGRAPRPAPDPQVRLSQPPIPPIVPELNDV